ncbi:alpha/beta fold hydrolase [Eoetvoesiella caeni]
MNALPSSLASGSGGVPLVMLHGMGSTAEIWLPQLNHFGRSRLALAWTQPGFGPSPALETLGWDSLADSLESLLQALGIGKAHILGHSIGGMVAQEFYHRHPQRVASLVLSATSAAFGSSDPQWKQEFIRQRTDAMAQYSSFAQAAPTLLSGFMGPECTPALREMASTAAREISTERYLDAMRLLVTFNRKAELGAIAVPTLLLAGELDTQAPPKGMKRMAEQIPNAQFQEIPAVRHMANLEAPHAFNQIIENFLSAQSQPAHA